MFSCAPPALAVQALAKCPVDDGCCNYYDGCNTCTRDTPQAKFSCTELFCALTGEPKCNARCAAPAKFNCLTKDLESTWTKDKKLFCCEANGRGCSRDGPAPGGKCAQVGAAWQAKGKHCGEVVTTGSCDCSGGKTWECVAIAFLPCPCDGKKCGDKCNPCPPGGGICLTVMGYCQADGGKCGLEKVSPPCWRSWS